MLENTRCFLALFILTPVATALPADTFTVNSSADGVTAGDDDANDGICAAPAAFGSLCTLRAAIEQANATVGPDIVEFDGNRTIDFTGLTMDIEDGYSLASGALLELANLTVADRTASDTSGIWSGLGMSLVHGTVWDNQGAQIYDGNTGNASAELGNPIVEYERLGGLGCVKNNFQDSPVQLGPNLAAWESGVLIVSDGFEDGSTTLWS